MQDHDSENYKREVIRYDRKILPEMGNICFVLVPVLKNFHLFSSMCPRIEIHFTTLTIERKIFNFY